MSWAAGHWTNGYSESAKGIRCDVVSLPANRPLSSSLSVQGEGWGKDDAKENKLLDPLSQTLSEGGGYRESCIDR